MEVIRAGCQRTGGRGGGSDALTASQGFYSLTVETVNSLPVIANLLVTSHLVPIAFYAI